MEEANRTVKLILVATLLMFVIVMLLSVFNVGNRKDDKRFLETQDDYRKRLIQQCIEEDEYTREECILIVTGRGNQ